MRAWKHVHRRVYCCNSRPCVWSMALHQHSTRDSRARQWYALQLCEPGLHCMQVSMCLTLMWATKPLFSCTFSSVTPTTCVCTRMYCRHTFDILKALQEAHPACASTGITSAAHFQSMAQLCYCLYTGALDTSEAAPLHGYTKATATSSVLAARIEPLLEKAAAARSEAASSHTIQATLSPPRGHMITGPVPLLQSAQTGVLSPPRPNNVTPGRAATVSVVKGEGSTVLEDVMKLLAQGDSSATDAVPSALALRESEGSKDTQAAAQLRAILAKAPASLLEAAGVTLSRQFSNTGSCEDSSV
jgi:hypothetical protein